VRPPQQNLYNKLGGGTKMDLHARTRCWPTAIMAGRRTACWPMASATRPAPCGPAAVGTGLITGWRDAQDAAGCAYPVGHNYTRNTIIVTTTQLRNYEYIKTNLPKRLLHVNNP